MTIRHHAANQRNGTVARPLSPPPSSGGGPIFLRNVMMLPLFSAPQTTRADGDALCIISLVRLAVDRNQGDGTEVVAKRMVRKLAEAVTRIYLIVPLDWLKEIDAWRRKHPEIPTRSAAIRQLVSEALASYRDREKKKK